MLIVSSISISTRNVGNILGQTLNVRSTNVSSETLSPIFVRQYVRGYRTDGASDIGIGMVNGANDVSVTNVGTNSDSINAIVTMTMLLTAPNGQTRRLPTPPSSTQSRQHHERRLRNI